MTEENSNLPPRIALYGNPVLGQKAKEIDLESTDDAKKLHDQVVDMISTMYLYGGIGLAGPQINIMKRIIVWDNCGCVW